MHNKKISHWDPNVDVTILENIFNNTKETDGRLCETGEDMVSDCWGFQL